MFAPIFICPTHGETWHVEHAEEFDTEQDEIYQFIVCQKCGSEVKPLIHEGHHVCHMLTDEEMFYEIQSSGDDE